LNPHALSELVCCDADSEKNPMDQSH